MGLGSRISKAFSTHIVLYFILSELTLSLLVSFSAIIAYIIFGVTNNSWIVIYLLSIAIGLLIGLEIPFATRINNEFEELRVNISNILEKDYYGSLLGGLFFAFVGLPYLGLTYTPFVLGIINFGISFWLFYELKYKLTQGVQKTLHFLYAITAIAILSGLYFAKPLVLFGEQSKYKDKIIYSKQTKYQKIVITSWNEWYSLYINGNQQLSTFDEYLYHEPMVHSVMNLSDARNNILVLGGGDGCAVREILKYDDVKKITLVDLDPEMIELGKSNAIFNAINENAFQNEKVQLISKDAFTFLENSDVTYDVIIVDLPDPNNVDLNKLYTKEFYKLCYLRLSDKGVFITQSGSPYYATKAFYCINKTLETASFHTLPLRNQILTLGEWSWIIGSKDPISLDDFNKMSFESKNLKWLNKEALPGLTAFGKPLIDTTGIEVNTIFSPTLYRYYQQGNWDLY